MSQLKLRHPDLQADSLHFDTLEVHAGEPRDAYGALIPPIYQTSTFYFDSTDDAVKACDDYAESFAYSRITNPSQDYLEQKLAALEHGKGAVAYASGMGAVSGALFAELKCGDHVIFTKAKYSGTEDITSDWLALRHRARQLRRRRPQPARAAHPSEYACHLRRDARKPHDGARRPAGRGRDCAPPRREALR